MSVDLNKLRKASENAADKVNKNYAEEIIGLVDFSNFSKIINELKKTSVDSKEIEKLRKEIENADNKNAVLLRVLKSGTTLANVLISIIQKK